MIDDLYDPLDVFGLFPTTPNAWVPEQAPNGAGFLRTLSQAETDTEAARLRSAGFSYRQIADRMGCSPGSAHARVERALAAVPVEAVETLRAVESEHLARGLRAVLAELDRDQPLVSHGRIIRDAAGEPLIDGGAKLAAVDRLVRLSESFRKLMGVDLPAKLDAKVTVEHTTTLDAEIASLMDRLGEHSDADRPA